MPFKEKKQKDDVYIPRRIVEKKQKDDVYIPAPKVVAVPTPAVNNNLRDPIRPTGPYFSPAQLAGWARDAANPQRQEQVYDSSAGRALPYTGLAASIPPTSPGVNILPVGQGQFPTNLSVANAPAPPQSSWDAGLQALSSLLNTPTSSAVGRGIDINAVVPTRSGTTNFISASNTPIMNVTRPRPTTPTPTYPSRAQETESDKLLKTRAQQAAADRLAGQAAALGPGVSKTKGNKLLDAGLRTGPPKIDPKTGVMSRGVLLEAARYTAAAMFQYNKLPNKMTLRLAQELPFGTLGYATAEAWLLDLGYYFDSVSGWWVLGTEGAAAGEGGVGEGEGELPGDGASDGGGGYGDYGGGGGWDDGGYGRVFQPSPSISRGSTFTAAGGGLVNWRIG